MSDEGAPELCSLAHRSEQLVFQNPILSCSRSYITKVLRTMIPVTNIKFINYFYFFNKRNDENKEYLLKELLDPFRFEKLPGNMHHVPLSAFIL